MRAGQSVKRIILISLVVIMLGAVTAEANPPTRVYSPVSRPHTLGEKAVDYTAMYIMVWVSLPVLLPAAPTIQFQGFYHNVIEMGPAFDNNRWTTNYVGHPIAGSEYYLYFRSRGYAPKWAISNVILFSTLWECTVEGFLLRPSIQDLIVTPIAGIPLGYIREKGGLRLVNSDKKFYRCLGHIIYWETNLSLFEEAQLSPAINTNPRYYGLYFQSRF